eukprot:TRINITY_DN1456_c0_g1_i3.p1 TRINITY_DN1456_c0_g1~~TRINITY_DN1456_c0_g1_i3.p1  ORF type:complete len:2371 (+),score=516.66 TRINITY_DN1456_c0_g1_i3:4402-11514(+)
MTVMSNLALLDLGAATQALTTPIPELPATMKTLNLGQQFSFTTGLPTSFSNLVLLSELTLGNQLTASFTSLSSLTSLTLLSLSGGATSRLSATFPLSLSAVPLRLLVVSGNNAANALPVLPTTLTLLSLASAGFSGAVAASIGGATALRTVVLSGNQLTGSLPSFATLPSIVAFDINSNSLSGPIPVFTATTLRLLDVSKNSFSGTVSFLSALIGLTSVNVGSNVLTGSLPTITALTVLSTFVASSNQFTGSVLLPFVVSALQRYDVSGNSLTGTIPTFLTAFTSLSHLNLASNMLSSTIPVLTSTLATWSYINFAHNSLTGTIPTMFPRFLSELHLEGNMLTGTIAVLTMPLALLSLSSNSLTGALVWPSGGLSNLQLDVSRNSLTGNPFAVGRTALSINLASNLFTGSFSLAAYGANLQTLIIASNQFSGILSEVNGFSRMTNLVVFDGSKNLLSGTVPQLVGAWASFLVSQNSFTGSLTVNNWANMIDFDVATNTFLAGPTIAANQGSKLTRLRMSLNQMTGTPPFCSPASVCAALVTYDISNNKMTGSLPDGWTAFTAVIFALHTLDVSHNTLSGTLPSVANLVNLRSLQLCYNNYTGTIPLSVRAFPYSMCLDSLLIDGLECPGGSSCRMCLPGTASHLQPAALPPTSCPLCAAGTFSNSSGESACFTCNPGTMSAANATACFDCGIGTYSATAPFDHCPQCTAGTFGNTTAVSRCRQCDVGQFSSTGVTVCETCDYGGYANVAGTGVCTACSAPASYTLRQGATASSECVTHGIVYIEPTTSPANGGAVVTIFGFNLNGGGSVASLTVGSASGVVLSVQAGSGTTQLSSVVVQMPAVSVGATVLTLTSASGAQSTASVTMIPGGIITSITPSSGSVGTVLTISGIQLGNGSDITTVTVNGVAAQVLAQFITSVNIVVPPIPTAGTATVVVSSTSRGSKTSTAFTVNPVGTATMTASTNVMSAAEGAEFVLTVALSASPGTGQSVVVGITSDCAHLSVVGGNTLTLTDSSWTGLSATIQITYDNTVRAPYSCTLSVGPSTSSNVAFVGLTAAIAAFTVLNSDVPGVRYAPVGMQSLSAGRLLMHEGDSAWFDVSLHSIPAQTVTVAVTFDVTGVNVFTGMTSNATALTFTPALWNVSQQAFVIAHGDGLITGALWATVTIAATSADPGFALLKQMRILVLDADGTKAVQMSPPHNSTVNSFEQLVVILTHPIANAISVSLTSSDTTQGIVAPASLIIQPSQLGVPFYVNLTGLDDGVINFGDVLYWIDAHAFGTGVDQQISYWLYNIDVNFAGLNVSKSAIRVNETGTWDIFTVAPQTEPISALTLSIVADTTVIAVQPQLLVFTAQTWQTPRVVTVTGLMNPLYNATDRIVTLSVRTIAGERGYANIQADVVVTNVGIHWPRVYNILPRTIAMAGVPVTARGEDLLSDAFMTIHTMQCVNASVTNGTELNCESLPVNFTSQYVNCSVYNPDGGWQLLVEAAYLSSDCPYEGLYGYGTDCQPCPDGGYCPGGYRVWPLPGWWTPNEFSGRVTACIPSVACAGERLSRCNTGYSGDFCAQCDWNFYRSGDGLCTACGSPAIAALFLLLQFSLVIMFLALALSVSTRTLGEIGFIVNCLRGLWITAGSVTGLPSWAQSVVDILSLLAGDFNFAQPGCSGITTFAQLFALNLGVVAAGFVALLVLLYIQYRAQTRVERRRASLGDPLMFVEVQVRLQQKFKLHATHVCSTYVMFVWGIVFTKAFQAVNCVPVEGELLLGDDFTLTCFQGVHWAMFLFALPLIFITFAVPVATTLIARHFRSGARVSAVQRGIVLAIQDDFGGSLEWCANAILMLGDTFLGMFQVFLMYHDGWAFIWTIICVCASLGFVAIVRPFRSVHKNVGSILVYIASLVAVIGDIFESDTQVYFAWVLMLLMALYTVGIIVVLIVLKLRKRLQLKKKQQAREEAAKKAADEGLDSPIMLTSPNAGSWDDDDELEEIVNSDTLQVIHEVKVETELKREERREMLAAVAAQEQKLQEEEKLHELLLMQPSVLRHATRRTTRFDLTSLGLPTERADDSPSDESAALLPNHQPDNDQTSVSPPPSMGIGITPQLARIQSRRASTADATQMLLNSFQRLSQLPTPALPEPRTVRLGSLAPLQGRKQSTVQSLSAVSDPLAAALLRSTADGGPAASTPPVAEPAAVPIAAAAVAPGVSQQHDLMRSLSLSQPPLVIQSRRSIVQALQPLSAVDAGVSALLTALGDSAIAIPRAAVQAAIPQPIPAPPVETAPNSHVPSELSVQTTTPQRTVETYVELTESSPETPRDAAVMTPSAVLDADELHGLFTRSMTSIGSSPGTPTSTRISSLKMSPMLSRRRSSAVAPAPTKDEK